MRLDPTQLTEVALEARSLDALSALSEGDAPTRLGSDLSRAAEALGGHAVWNINSTAEGGGVAEMLHALLPYLRDVGWNVRWMVMSGEDGFFDLTKGLHEALHGVAPADDIRKRFDELYAGVTERSAADLLKTAKPGDVAVVHDPQAAGLVKPLAEAGLRVSWQCHIGTDVPNDCSRMAWDLLRPFVAPAHRYVFSRDVYLWEGLDPDRLRVIPPAIDAFAPKNEAMTDEQVEAVLVAADIYEGAAGSSRPDADIRTRRSVARTGGPLPLPADAPVVLQVSRWDRLKDPIGFIRMFADHLSDIDDLHAIYAGPDTKAVDDDPEGAEVHAACEETWRSLAPDVRDRLHLLSIPMEDLDENAEIVNALQRRADVVVQKSLQEGFGLTVAEAMWKGRPVVGSRIGGIQDQIEDGRSGRLIDDPHDVTAFADAVRDLILEPSEARRLGEAAHERVRKQYLAPRILGQYADLVTELAGSQVTACS